MNKRPNFYERFRTEPVSHVFRRVRNMPNLAHACRTLPRSFWHSLATVSFKKDKRDWFEGEPLPKYYRFWVDHRIYEVNEVDWYFLTILIEQAAGKKCAMCDHITYPYQEPGYIPKRKPKRRMVLRSEFNLLADDCDYEDFCNDCLWKVWKAGSFTLAVINLLGSLIEKECPGAWYGRRR